MKSKHLVYQEKERGARKLVLTSHCTNNDLSEECDLYRRIVPFGKCSFLLGHLALCLLSLTIGHFTAALQDPKHFTQRASTIVAAKWFCWDATRVFCLEDGGSNVTTKGSKFLPAYTMSYYRRQQTLQSP